MESKQVLTKLVFDMETFFDAGKLVIDEIEGYDYAGPWDLAEGAEGDADPATQGDGAAEGEGHEGEGDGYFLDVDDRTRYRTKEDAVKAYQESGRRIAELDPWRQTATDYGVRDPREIAALLDELIELRAAKTGPQSRGAEGSQPAASGAGATATDPKQAEAIAWLKAHGVEAGYVPQEKLEELVSRLDRADEALAQADDERFTRRIDEGRGYLKSELDSQGVKFADAKTSEQFNLLLENSLTTWINQDQRRIVAFHQGGESLKALVHEGISEIAPLLNVLKNQPAANLAATKTNAQIRSRAPQTRTAVRPAPKVANGEPLKKKNPLDTGEDFTSDVHNAAFEAFQRASQ